jgi:hypothetical protein
MEHRAPQLRQNDFTLRGTAAPPITIFSATDWINDLSNALSPMCSILRSYSAHAPRSKRDATGPGSIQFGRQLEDNAALSKRAFR